MIGFEANGGRVALVRAERRAKEARNKQETS